MEKKLTVAIVDTTFSPAGYISTLFVKKAAARLPITMASVFPRESVHTGNIFCIATAVPGFLISQRHMNL
jgi:hypothetical protein